MRLASGSRCRQAVMNSKGLGMTTITEGLPGPNAA